MPPPSSSSDMESLSTSSDQLCDNSWSKSEKTNFGAQNFRSEQRNVEREQLSVSPPKMSSHCHQQKQLSQLSQSEDSITNMFTNLKHKVQNKTTIV